MRKIIHTIFCLIYLVFPSMVSCNDLLSQGMEAWSAGYPPALFGEKLINGQFLKSYYEDHRSQPIWFERDRLSKNGRALINSINTIAGEGLLPGDYHASILKTIPDNTVIADSSLYDFVLSDAFVSLVHHLQSGKVDPESLTKERKTNRRQGNLTDLLSEILANKDVTEILNKARPNQIRYFRLKDALAWVKNLPQENWETLTQKPTIKPGMKDDRLKEISRRLMVWNDLADYVSTEDYDDDLQDAVKRFQMRHGLDPDGIIGKETIQALNVSPYERSKQIIVNLERWRWLAEDFGKKFLVVNIAAFELKIIDKNETIFQRPVVAGRNYRKTPVFSDNIRYLVFNPTWTVPQKLAVEDKLPEIKRDKNYLKRLGFSVYPVGSSTEVDPDSVNWSHLSKTRFPYRLVQAPGPLNSLGQIKFMFPNPYDVYLHDTPSRELFKKSERAFSSGCIRVSDPLELAEILLRDQKWTKERIQSVIDRGVTETVHLTNPMPIHIEYWTAWVDRGGMLHFRKDIYERDNQLWEALNFPLTDLGQKMNGAEKLAP